MTTSGERFERLVDIMKQLRAPGGCPWDREQTFDSIKPYLLEETYEVMDAIDARDWDGLADELGDLLLQAVFFGQMASEAGHFDITQSLEAINPRFVRRPSAERRTGRVHWSLFASHPSAAGSRTSFLARAGVVGVLAGVTTEG